jgi:chloramphenicol 3-O-phosphotransferase
VNGSLASTARRRCSLSGGHYGWLVEVGTKTSRLIVLRGNSGSGKSSVAAEMRARYGRGIALVGQDYLRRIVLHERDIPGGVNIGLIDSVARYALDNGFHVILDGILDSRRYAGMLGALRRDHRGASFWYYLDVPFEETMRRHATRPQAAEFGRAEMRRWYRKLDLLPGANEQIIPSSNSLDDTVRQVMRDASLASQQQLAFQS